MGEGMLGVARQALAQIPPACRFRPVDAQAIAVFREQLLGWEPELVRAFYDTVYGHPETSAVFVDGERAAREGTLTAWWRRTVAFPVDDEYFAWMAMVGLVHVARGVGNPMMLSMTHFVSSFVAGKALGAGADPAAVQGLVEAFQRLSSTVGSVISFGFDHAYDRAVVAALNELAGMPEALFQRLRHQEVVSALAQARTGGAAA